MGLRTVSLADRLDLGCDRVLISGTQAIVRLCLMQKARDAAAGLATAGYVTGYRGSPLGALDQQMVRAAAELAAADIVFQPAINEELAATAMWGAQQAHMRGEGRFDGVFGVWYGKGPGVDRAGDALRHANLAGTAPDGGVIALMGDDHTCESSTTAHQSEFAFVDAMIPILSPAGVQEILDYGLHGWGLSRFAGTWAGLKCVKDTVESAAVVDGSPHRVSIVRPEDFALPDGGLGIRVRDHPLDQEARLHRFKTDAAAAYVRANALDRLVMAGGSRPRLGIVTAGKSYLDVRQALDDLGIDEAKAARLGLRLYKVACTWPLEPDGARRFAAGLERILVVEEKRGLIEAQLREVLYGGSDMPLIEGKKDAVGAPLFPAEGALEANDIAVAIGERLAASAADEEVAARTARLREAQARLAASEDAAVRTPYFCAGCPHSSSTVIPEGSRAYAGIGCHYMAQWMERGTEGYTQMGGEGANWVGEAPFSARAHVFQNIGDGTYNHSGYLALRAARAAGVNITYKILFNDAVAMTGGQRNDGGLTVPDVAAQVAAEGARAIAIVTDEPGKYAPGTRWPSGATIHHRDELIAVQERLCDVPGLSVLIYDQTCAAEKRRRRRRGTYPDPDRRVFINELVCEGCGDCGEQSNCVAVVPVETEFGRKRRIDQSACNKDFSCLKGFCPSFVTVEGGRLRRGAAASAGERDALLPDPEPVSLERPFGMLVTGIGGTGVVTIGALIAMAAHLEGKGAAVIDMAGLAQKGGAVTSHVRIARRPQDISAIRVGAGAADLVLGCDLAATGARKVLAAIARGRTAVVINTHETYPGEIARRPDLGLPTARVRRALAERAGGEGVHAVAATDCAVATFGDAMLANVFLLGFSWQLGRLPVSAAAIEQAVALNGVRADENVAAFRMGRRAAHDPQWAPRALAAPAGGPAGSAVPASLDETIEARAGHLAAYQDAAYAGRYRERVARVRAAEARAMPGSEALTAAVARQLFRLMAVKDEYEVARLYTDGSFARALEATFEGDVRLSFHMAPPGLARRDPRTGLPQKRTFGPWMMRAMRLLARARRIRGTALDPFGYAAERREERALAGEYEALIDEILPVLAPHNHTAAVALAGVAARIRGFGHVKARNLEAARAEQAALLAAFRAGETRPEAAE